MDRGPADDLIFHVGVKMSGVSHRPVHPCAIFRSWQRDQFLFVFFLCSCNYLRVLGTALPTHFGDMFIASYTAEEEGLLLGSPRHDSAYCCNDP